MIQNGKYTIENTETCVHRTFKVHTAQSGKLEGKRIVSLLTGPDNQRDYVGFAFLDDRGIRIWGRFRGTQYEALGQMLWDGLHRRLPARYDVLHEGTCIICNRPLTSPESIRSGIGPVCAEKGLG